MDLAKQQRIIEILNRYNPWWKDGSIRNVPSVRRRDFHKLHPKITQTKDILAIVGARQVGKTTMLKQCIEELLKGGTTPQDIIYISVDEQLLLDVSEKPINDILEVYQTSIAKKGLGEIIKPIYVFIDEVQKIHDWSLALKNWHDLYPHIKFVLSGSSSLNIYEDSKEALVGRILYQIVLPLKFSDFVLFRKPDVYKKVDITHIGLTLRKALQASLSENSPNSFIGSLLKNYGELSKIKYELNGLLEDFFILGGYPEIASSQDYYESSLKLRTNIDGIIRQDIQRMFGIRDSTAMWRLMKLLSENTSNKANVQVLSSVLGVSHITIKSYISYLEKAFLISQSEVYTGSLSTRTKKQRKIYVNDVGIRNALLDKFSRESIKGELGKLAETIVYNHCLRLQFNLRATIEPNLKYWSNTPKEWEVDIIFEYGDRPLPIEVKYKESPEGFKGLHDFMKEFKAPFAVVVTKDYLQLKDRIVYVPMWVFLLLA